MQFKIVIRRSIKSKIRAIDPLVKQQAVDNMTKLVTDLLSKNYSKTKRVACYINTVQEISTNELLVLLSNLGKKCYLPRIDFENSRLNFFEYTSSTELVENKFNILEPKYNPNKLINLEDLDLIFLPLVAFDNLGHRIGSGGGWYDRTLKPYDQLAINATCKLIGLAYALQQVANFVPEPWYANLDQVITEKAAINFKQGTTDPCF